MRICTWINFLSLSGFLKKVSSSLKRNPYRISFVFVFLSLPLPYGISVGLCLDQKSICDYQHFILKEFPSPVLSSTLPCEKGMYVCVWGCSYSPLRISTQTRSSKGLNIAFTTQMTLNIISEDSEETGFYSDAFIIMKPYFSISFGCTVR